MSLKFLLPMGVLLLTSGLSTESDAVGQDAKPATDPVEAAFEQSAATGRPVLIVGARSTCGLCTQFLSTLQSDARARPLVAQFIPVKLDVDDRATWGKIARRFKPAGTVLPGVVVVRADGKALHSEFGAPPQVPAFLANQLQQSGKILNNTQAEQLSAAVKSVEEHVAAGEIDDAVSLIKKFGNTGSFASSAVALNDAATKLQQQAEELLAGAAENLKSPDTAFNGALQLAEVDRKFSGIPEVAEKVREQQKVLRKDETLRDVLSLAEHFDRGVAQEAAERWQAAVTAYQQVIADAPDSAAAKQAQAKVAELSKKVGDGTPAKTTTVMSSDEKRAASFLRLGKQLAKRKPEKAEEYYRKAIELAPDSPTAAAARELLK